MAHRPATASKRPLIGAVGPNKALYVDGNNFLGLWMGLPRRMDLYGMPFPMLYTQCLDCLEANIKDFLSHARGSGWVVKVFFDSFKKVMRCDSRDSHIHGF